MELARVKEILDGFPRSKILVVGDYFLDYYFNIERSLSEISLETGLEAYQVRSTRKYPGAAGTVAANLRSLDVPVVAVGAYGDDGNGYDLIQRLHGIGVDTCGLVQSAAIQTPTYHKPMMREIDGREHELNRLDIKNRAPLPAEVEDEVIRRLHYLVLEAAGVIVLDQVKEKNCGVITERVREAVQELARTHTQKIFMVDSRDHARSFTDLILKTNLSEALRSLDCPSDKAADPDQIRTCCQAIYSRTGRPLVITRGEDGAIVYDGQGDAQTIPTYPVSGPVDIVGAGDSVSASLTASLCAGASLAEAALIGNMTASLIIQQIGVTGVTTRNSVLERFQDFVSAGAHT